MAPTVGKMARAARAVTHSLSDRLTSRDNRHAEPQDFCHEKSSPRNKAENLCLGMTRRLIGA